MESVMRRFWQDDSGQATVEWTILAISMAIIAMGIVALIGPAIYRKVEEMLRELEG